MLIREDDLTGAEIAALLQLHLDHMSHNSPPESIHALDLDALRRPEITFWTIWDDAELLGCGALNELDAKHGEIKSMHTAQAQRGRGIAGRIVRHLIDVAQTRAYRPGPWSLCRIWFCAVRPLRVLSRGSLQRVHDFGAGEKAVTADQMRRQVRTPISAA